MAVLGFFALVGTVLPTSTGYQDISSLLARQPYVAEHWRQHLIASPFGTIHMATFQFPRPLGASIPTPPGYQLASLDPNATDAFPIARFFDTEPPRVFPEVNRALKGDRLVVSRRDPEPASPTKAPILPQQDQTASLDEKDAGTSDVNVPLTVVMPSDVARLAPSEPSTEANEADEVNVDLESSDTEAARRDTATPDFGADSNPLMQTARAYFSNEPMTGDTFGTLQPWGPGESPVLEGQRVADPDLKQQVTTAPAKDGEITTAKLEPPTGETVVAKGEVKADIKGDTRLDAGDAIKQTMLKSPAERLGLEGSRRAKAEKCLADAIYFEARGEQPRGQMAVAQVVMNRVFSGFYPNTVCGVVYQNAHRYLACQFTFACDGIPDRITEPDAWELAKKIARDTLDGKIWLSEIGKATHYHAYWVRPGWVREMHKLKRLGVHTFYRPRAWGDGAEAPRWGIVETTTEASSKL